MTSPLPLVVTGHGGFLGWHVRVLARVAGLPEPVAADLRDPLRLTRQLDGADRVLHLAGVNRGDDVVGGNARLADTFADALRRCSTPPKTVVYANSIQAGNGTPYGDGKAAAADTLAEVTRWSGSSFEDVRLPNLFGEHGRPHYNSVVATFCRVLADGGTPRVDSDRELPLWHATDAATTLTGLDRPVLPETRIGVRELAGRLARFAAVYRTGDLPDLTDPFDVRLFNTYRSHLTPAAIPLTRHADQRGELVEAVRAHGGGGQTFVSSTLPGVTRGDHFHLAKVERFAVLRGEAEIALRRVLHDEVVTIRVTGDAPSVVDMPAMWAHRITNVGTGELLTLFWAHELFDPARPDTHPERVTP